MGASTSIAVSGRITIKDKPVILNAGDPTKMASGLVFTLNDPTPLGTAVEFVGWLKDSFGVDVDLKSLANQVPPPLTDAFKSFINGTVVLDSMTINRPQSLYQLAVSYDLGNSPITLLPGLAFNGVGVVVTHQITSALSANIDDKQTTVPVTKGDGKQFTPPAGQTLTIVVESETMTVQSVSGDTLNVTRGTPAAKHDQGTAVRLGS